MPVLFRAFLVLAAALLAQGVISLRDGYRFLAYLRRSLRTPPAEFHPPAAVMVPVKGIDPALAGSVDALLSQDYPHYHLIFAVARESDPAYTYLAGRVRTYRAEAGHGPREVKLVVAGVTPERGEKVNNLLSALSVAPAALEVLVFADADAHPKSNWLRSLVGALSDPAVTMSTGFRWYLPGQSFGSRVRAAWDTSIATLLGEHRSNFAWGGSMAIRTQDFRRLRVAENYWAHTVSDDYGLTRAVRDAGGWIRFEPKCLVASAGETSFGDFLRWANRQIIITRVYARHLWIWGLASQLLFCGTLMLGLVMIVIAPAAWMRLLAAGIEFLALLLGLAKARLRTRAARELFPEEGNRSRAAASCYWRLWPLVPWIMLINFVTAGFTRRIEWGGARYKLISATEMRVLGTDR